jgi:hypothetical protein
MATMKFTAGFTLGIGGGPPVIGKTVDRDDHVYKAKLCEQVQRYDGKLRLGTVTFQDCVCLITYQ